MTEPEAMLWLYLCPKLSEGRRQAMLASQTSARATVALARRIGLSGPPSDLMDQARASSYVTRGQPGYPHCFASLSHPPDVIFYRGNLEMLKERSNSLTIVGTRYPTASGRVLARSLATDLSQMGISIVSGLAVGIDTAAHQGSLDGQGASVAIAGCGLNYCYPESNRRVFQALCENGLVVSEYPPWTPPYARNFPRRNRLLAAASEGLLVLEAPRASGVLTTVDHALQQGKEVLVVPGPVDQPNYAGSLQLLRDGAQLVTTSKEIAEHLWPARSFVPQIETGPVRPARPEEWARRWGMPLPQAIARLSRWELIGKMRCDDMGHFELLGGA